MSNKSPLPASYDKADIRRHYTGMASRYDFWGKLTESKARDRCLELAAIQDGEVVLEVAVGTGLTFYEVLQHNRNGRVEGIDLTPEMLAQAQQKAAQTGHSNYDLRVGDAYKLDYDDAAFDVLINNYMFDMLPEADFSQVLAEFQRVLRPGGRLVLVNMAKATHWYQTLWETMYRIQPRWLGGCRSVSLSVPLNAAGFQVEQREFVSQMTFPSEVILAIKPL
ncbi:MAG: methyltransferase domain-containing protein [Ardenticatenaceae bacterium]|nr:methyltransferase domain-containing protein [Anaerolineales bacterium]MCB8921114.1 methyltransferase domain-containing protein [Ardenticatenaceae bacterium]MCB8990819.1 methyltransferase domain-containing protein [Ardenticatenaceae bacterium]MCB9004487.1 methyltransferase domain-containing protein [Ardenticatenaceae bacterium]